MITKAKNISAHLPLLQSFPQLELRTPYHLSDLQPFSLEWADYSRRIQSVALLFLIAGLLVITSALSLTLWQQNPLITAENALLELGQGGLLLAAALIQGLRALNSTPNSLKRDVRLGLALFAFAFFLREVDIDQLGASAYWALVEKLLRASALLMIGVFIFHMLPRLQLMLRCLPKVMGAPTVLVSLLACVLYASGWPFDKGLTGLDSELSLWFEETLELNACLLLLCASALASVRSDMVQIKAPSL